MAMPVGISPRRVMQMLELQIHPCAHRRYTLVAVPPAITAVRRQ
jgi:hypothetical protein